MNRRALSVLEACEAYRVSRTFLYGQIKAGFLRVRKAGRRTLIDPEDADRWFKALPISDGLSPDTSDTPSLARRDDDELE